MPNITYSLGGISFDAVPRRGIRTIDIPNTAYVSIGRKRLVSLSAPNERLILAGDYLTEATRASLEALIEQTESSGAKHTFDDGASQRYAIIERFSCEAIVGCVESAYKFEMQLLLLGEVTG
jgi:hypothetical protein